METAPILLIANHAGYGLSTVPSQRLSILRDINNCLSARRNVIVFRTGDLELPFATYNAKLLSRNWRYNSLNTKELYKKALFTPYALI